MDGSDDLAEVIEGRADFDCGQLVADSQLSRLDGSGEGLGRLAQTLATASGGGADQLPAASAMFLQFL